MNSTMTEQRVMLADSIARLLRDSVNAPGGQAAVSEGWPAALWRQLEEMGLPMLLVDEAAGGFGGDWEDAQIVAQAMGMYAVGLPLLETMLARRLASRCGIALPGGVVGSFVVRTGLS